MIRSRRYRVMVGALTLAALCYIGWMAVHDDRIQVDCLTPWKGSVAFINLPGEADILLDSGPAQYSSRVLRHLRQCGVDELGVLVLTHADAAHVGGALDIMQSFPVHELWCSDYKGRSPVFRRVITYAQDMGIKIRVLTAGDHGVFSGGTAWEVFHPRSSGKYSRADDASLVIRFARDQVSVLFMGGAGGASEAEICKGPQEPSATVLVQGAHKGKRACTAQWLDVVEPLWVIIGRPSFCATFEPEPRILQRLSDRGIRVWNMANEGSVRLQWGDAPFGLSILPLVH